jgi:hypothetical protein
LPIGQMLVGGGDRFLPARAARDPRGDEFRRANGSRFPVVLRMR